MILFVGLLLRYQLNVWDVGGQKTLRPYWRNYYEQTDALVWVVDSCDVRRLEDCRNELKALLQEEVLEILKISFLIHFFSTYITFFSQEQKLLGATLLVLANKQDLTNAVNVEIIEKVAVQFSNHFFLCIIFLSCHVFLGQILELKSMDSDRHWKIFKCSAVNGEGILEAFHWLVDDVGSRIYMYD